MIRNCRPPANKPPSLSCQTRTSCVSNASGATQGTATHCGSTESSSGENVITSAAHNLDLDALCVRLGRFGPLEEQPCYVYVVETLELDKQGDIKQTASAPNFNGGFITLCTCKHSTRAVLTPSQWRDGVWIAGMTGSGKRFGYRQALTFLMRVGEAYPSQFDLVQALKASGRNSTLDAKSASRHPNGDVLIPRSMNLTQAQRVSAEFYHPPTLPHAHRTSHDDTYWHKDADHVDQWGRRPAYLVGDPNKSFTWSRQMILNTNPGNLRPHRAWTLAQFVGYLTKSTV